jgi:antitoxin component YwqK of YwqJK toxin-antitoxin module
MKSKIPVPDVYINADDIRPVIKNGITNIDSIPFSGITYGLYPNGDTAFLYHYCKGKLQGKTQEWYSNRQLKEIRFYEDGRKTGTHTGWYPNGQLRFVYHMRADHFEGNVKEWFESGQLYRSFNYVNGQEEGMETMYYSNGKIKANYQSINGRKYGLTGVKNCESVWAGDSVVRH